MSRSEAGGSELLTFGPFTLDVFARTLVSHDLDVPLQPKAFELLEYLARNAGRLIRVPEMLDALWPGEELTETALIQQMLALRATIARHSPRTTYVVTERGGYRFVAPVTRADGAAAAEDPAKRLYARGRYFYEKRTADSLHRSIHHFRQAIELDPSFARAYAALANAFGLSGEYLLLPPDDAFPAAADTARRALALDPTLADAHVVLGHGALYYDRDLARAERHYAQAAALAPHEGTTVVRQALLLCVADRTDEAIALLREAVEREPYSLLLRTMEGVVSIFRRAFNEALAQFRAVLAMDADYPSARFYLAMALQLAGRHAEALQAIAGPVPDGVEQQTMALRGSSLGRLGAIEEGQAVGDAIRALVSRGRFVSCFNLAWVALGCGDPDHAMRLLEAELDQRDPLLVFVPAYPVFDDLRGDPRYAALMKRVRRGPR